jgi:hypothetical protein
MQCAGFSGRFRVMRPTVEFCEDGYASQRELISRVPQPILRMVA